MYFLGAGGAALPYTVYDRVLFTYVRGVVAEERVERRNPNTTPTLYTPPCILFSYANRDFHKKDMNLGSHLERSKLMALKQNWVYKADD